MNGTYMTDTNDSSVVGYQITSLSRTELILINENGEKQNW